MAAKEISVFVPSDVDHRGVLSSVVDSLGLAVDSVPLGSPYAFSAQRRDDNGYLLIEFDFNARDVIEEMEKWEKPSSEYKRILGACGMSIVVHYRKPDDLRRCLVALGKAIGSNACRCVLENGLGVVILLSDVVDRFESDSTWSIEREDFPELIGVAPSEWID
jgi:hypothetical protein